MGKIKDIITELEITQEQLKDKEISNYLLQVAYRQSTGKWIRYKNGNGICEINKEDGTMITTVLADEEFNPEFPNNIDMNISNKCFNCSVCEFCYQGCTIDGKEANIRKFIEDKNSFLYSLQEGTELAINGNEPLHKDLELLLQFCKQRNIFANLTVKENTLLNYKTTLKSWLKKGLIHGIGISPISYSEEMVNFCKEYPTSVIHTIAGITTKEQYESLYNKNLKILILGYKTFGKGISYKENYKDIIKNNITWLKNTVKDFIRYFKVVSFDNLAIEQLEPKSFLTNKEWNLFYRGDDGHHTMYIDLVKETFSKNSIATKEESYLLLNNISDMLKFIRSKIDDS